MATGKIILKAQDQTKSGVNSAKQNLKELNEVAGALGINLGKLTQVGMVTAAIAGLTKGAKECVNAFLRTETTYLSLKASLGNSQSYDKAISSISRLSKATLASQEDVAKLYTELVQLGKGEDDINKILEASINLSNVTGKDLNGAMELLLGTFQGSAGELTKYLPNIAKLTKEELSLGGAVEYVNQNLGKTGALVASQSYSQSIKNIKDDVNSIATSLGSVLLDQIEPVFDYVEDWLSHIDTELKKLASRATLAKENPSIAKAFNSMQTRNISAPLAFAGTVNSKDDALYAMRLAETLDKNSKKESAIYEAVLAYVKKLYPDIEEYFAEYKKYEKSRPVFTSNSSSSSSSTSSSVSYDESITAPTVDITTSVKSILSSYSQYLTPYYSNQYEILKAQEALAEHQKVYADAVKELSEGIGDEQYVQLLKELIAVEEDSLETLKKPKADNSNAISAIKSYSSYLSSSSQSMFSALYDNGNSSAISAIESVISELPSTDIMLIRYLEEIKANLTKGLDPSISSNVKSLLSANTRYFNDEETRQFEILKKQDELKKSEELYADALKQLSLGNLDKETVNLLKALVEGQKQELDQMKKGGGTASSNSLDLSSMSDAFSEVFSSENADLAVLSDFTAGLNDILEAMGPIGSILLSSNPLLALLMEIVSEMCTNLAPFIEQVVKPLNDTISVIAKLLSDAIVPVLEPIKGIVGAIAAILQSVLLPILNIFTPLLKIIVGVLTIFKPILEFVVNAFVYVGTVIDLVASAIEWAIGSFLNWLADLHIFGWHPFGDLGGHDVTAPSWDASYNKIKGNATSIFEEGYSGFEDTSTSTSVSTASYQGASTFYFNIYQQAPVVGDGGMKEFAKMIKTEFAELAYLGA